MIPHPHHPNKSVDQFPIISQDTPPHSLVRPLGHHFRKSSTAFLSHTHNLAVKETNNKGSIYVFRKGYCSGKTYFVLLERSIALKTLWNIFWIRIQNCS